jgi:hypothetical protein
MITDISCLLYEQCIIDWAKLALKRFVYLFDVLVCD